MRRLQVFGLMGLREGFKQPGGRLGHQSVDAEQSDRAALRYDAETAIVSPLPEAFVFEAHEAVVRLDRGR
jgi:hypothetical protein